MLQEELRTIQSSKNRRFWVRRWILRRNLLGASEPLLRELALEDNGGYRDHLRTSEEKCEELLLQVQDARRPIRRRNVPTEKNILPR